LADVSKTPFTGLQTAIAAYKNAFTAQQMSTNDTVTLPDFASITTVLAMRDDTGTSVTTSVSNNVITLTQAAITKVNISMLVWGTHA
jgi:hypothetical protein